METICMTCKKAGDTDLAQFVIDDEGNWHHQYCFLKVVPIKEGRLMPHCEPDKQCGLSGIEAVSAAGIIRELTMDEAISAVKNIINSMSFSNEDGETLRVKRGENEI